MIRISSLILIVTFFGFPTCEENDKFINKGHMVFVGGELVGEITILKSAVYKRGHIKLRCCSECLRELDCSGTRIDFNSSSCSLLKGQFFAIEQPLSSSQIFMKTGTATVTTSTMQMSSIAESSSKTTPVTGYETPFVTEINSTETVNETAPQDTVTGTTPSVIVNKTTTPETVTEPTFTETVTEPTFTETVTEPTFTETVTEPTFTETVTEPTFTDTVTEPTFTETVTEPTFTETVTEPTFTETVTEPTFTETVTEPTFTETVTEPTFTETVTEPTFTETVTETTSPDTVNKTTFSDSVKGITFPDTDTLSPHNVTEKNSPNTVIETTSPDTVNETSSSDILNETTFPETVTETTRLNTEPGTTYPDILNETTSTDTVTETSAGTASETLSQETVTETTPQDTVTETTSLGTVAETIYSDVLTSPSAVNKTTQDVVTETATPGTEFATTLMGFSSTKVALVTSTERVCSDCECIGITTSLSGVYEITVNGQLTSVYCEMKYGFQWTVVFRRTVGNVLFNNVWTSYTNGFGNLDGDFWLGLDNIHNFTSSGQSVMRVEMEDINGQTGFAQYSTFLVGSPSSGYKLIVSQYAGNSGYDAFIYHNNMKFSTKDRDNDLSSSINCASYYGEPWWNNDCSRMIFTRNNFNDLGWYNWYTGSYKQLSKIRMMIRKPLIVETSGCSDCDCVGSLTTVSGVYEITADGNPLQVYCEMNDGYNWMVIFRRIKGDVLFNNIWTSYENGFGNLDGDFWQGLKHINKFSAAGWSVMRVEMEDIVGYYGYAQYSTFHVGDAASGYRLTISGYSGTAGYDALSIHNGRKFSTKDVDNDLSVINCALKYGSPWWNNDCGLVKFTLNDFNGLGWYNWHTGSYRPLVRVKMAIRK